MEREERRKEKEAKEEWEMVGLDLDKGSLKRPEKVWFWGRM